MGMKLVSAADTGRVHVWNVVPGTQAHKLKVQRTDTLVSVNYEEVEGLAFEDVIGLIAKAPVRQNLMFSRS